MTKRVAVVTGGSAGIGRQALREFLELGYDVASFARRMEPMEETRAEFEKLGRYLTVQCDVTDEESVRDSVKKVEDEYGRIDVLVNNAGGSGGKKIPADELTLEFLDEMIRFNVRSIFLCCKYVVPIMKKQMYGRIINLSSGAGRGRSVQGSAAYVASKAGAIGFTRHGSRDLGPYNITMNCVAPGLILTDRVTQYWEKQRTPEERKQIMAQTPAGRLGNAHDISRAITFLADEAAGYITGAIFDVNGGVWVG